MTIRKLAELGKQMRAAQNAFFRKRSPELMRESKRIEAEFDAAVDEALAPTLGMGGGFDDHTEDD